MKMTAATLILRIIEYVDLAAGGVECNVTFTVETRVLITCGRTSFLNISPQLLQELDAAPVVLASMKSCHHVLEVQEFGCAVLGSIICQENEVFLCISPSEGCFNQ